MANGPPLVGHQLAVGWQSEGNRMALGRHSDGNRMALGWHSDGNRMVLGWHLGGAHGWIFKGNAMTTLKAIATKAACIMCEVRELDVTQ